MIAFFILLWANFWLSLFLHIHHFFNLPMASVDSCFFFFLSSSSFPLFVIGLFMYNFMWFIKLGVRGMCWICAGVYRCAEVCVGVHECVQVCSGVCGYAWVCKGMCRCIWDEFSEYLMETRILTSADFHTYPIRIF